MNRLEEILRIENSSEREQAYRQFRHEQTERFARSRADDAEQTQHIINITECLNFSNTHVALQTITQCIPVYDGYNMPLKEFVQDVENARSLITPAKSQLFLRTIISKIKGKARQTLKGYEFANLEALI